MRDFSSFEKDVLSKMVALQNEGKLCRYNLLYSINKAIEIEEIDYADIQIVSDTIEKNSLRKILIQLSLLFEYLISNYYLIDFARDIDNKIELNKTSSKKFIIKADRSYPKECFIYKYNCYYELLLSETIVDLVKHQFKTAEQRRFEIQLMEARTQYKHTIFWTRASFFVALCAALAAIIIPFYSSTKIEKSQYKEIKQEINGIQSALKDTLQIKPIDENLTIKK